MDFETYIPLAQRTCASLPTRKDDNDHFVLGMVTEAGELADVFKKNLAYGKPLDWVNVQEEIGDALWYVANFVAVNHITTRGLFVRTAHIGTAMPEVNRAASLRIAGQAGRLAAMFSEPRVDWSDLRMALIDFIESLVMFCNYNSLDVFKIMDTNIAKLRARYPEKFDADKAINRDLDAERGILEGKE